MMSIKPTIALIPGSFSTIRVYERVIEQLTKHNFPVFGIELKSVGGLNAATSTDDAAHINSILAPLVEEGKQIVVVMHSYGGIPGTDGTKDLAKVDQQARGKEGGVIGLVYIAALMVQQGASLSSTRGDLGPLPDWVTVDGEFMSMDKVKAARETFSDLPEDEAGEWANVFQSHAMSSFGTELVYPAYRFNPSWYILTEGDKIVGPEEQQNMVDKARENNSNPIKIVKLQSSHGPIVSQPEKVVDVIRQAAGEQI